MQDFRKLTVWQMAHHFVVALYRSTDRMPREERYGLTSQIRRAGVSIASNIAEGCGRNGDAEFARFCQIAMGSASEVEYQLLLARDLKFIDSPTYETLSRQLASTRRMLNRLIQTLRASQ